MFLSYLLFWILTKFGWNGSLTCTTLNSIYKRLLWKRKNCSSKHVRLVGVFQNHSLSIFRVRPLRAALLSFQACASGGEKGKVASRALRQSGSSRLASPSRLLGFCLIIVNVIVNNRAFLHRKKIVNVVIDIRDREGARKSRRHHVLARCRQEFDRRICGLAANSGVHLFPVYWSGEKCRRSTSRTKSRGWKRGDRRRRCRKRFVD